MILSDGDILDRLAEEDLVIEPLDDIDQQVQPASVDLKLGSEFLKFQRVSIPFIDPSDETKIEDYLTEIHVEEGEQFIIQPGDFVLGTTREHVEIPNDLVGKIEGRSSLGRLAIIIHATAGFIDPGWKGKITLEISNLGAVPIALQPGMRVSQLVLTELKTPAKRPYGEERGSKYQNQTGPQASKIQDDEELN